MRTHGLLLLTAVVLSACRDETPMPASSTSAGAPASIAVSASSDAPITQYTAKTTSPSIELNNLDAQVQSADKQFGAHPDDFVARTKLVGLLLLRGRVLGKSEDLARAVELAEVGPTAQPKGYEGYLLRARGRSAAHRFKDALSDLDLAEKQLEPRASKAPILGLRATLFVAVGRYEDALPLMEKRSRTQPSTATLGDHAALLGRMGQYKEADALFLQAETKFRSISPIPLVELYFDRAAMWERAGNLELATKVYRAAKERLPQHVHVATHLAGLIAPSEAIPMLEPLTALSDDADLFAQLGILKNLLASKSGDASLARAKDLYDAHYAKLPEAYADHAGWFWVNAGGDASKALAAAKKNLEQRQTPEAYELLLAAATAADDLSAKCQAKRAAAALKYSTPRLSEQLRQLEGKIACPHSGITPAPATSGSVSPP